jgi:hypothetical protein
MPTIYLEFDDTKVSDKQATELSWAVQKIVSEVTGIEDVFIYGNSARIKIQIAPIEIFIKLSAHKIKDRDTLFDDIKSKIHSWKDENHFAHPINLTLIPMDWRFEVDI